MNPNREEHLFQLALTQPAAGRAAWLERECAGDTALRQRLEALLAAHEQTGGALADEAPTATATMKVELPDAPDETVGQKTGPLDGLGVGRYKILEKVGEGGCGTVYVAEQTEPVRRRVALKVIKLGMDTKEVIARFEAERQALAMMDHPNIAKVLDAGSTDSGRPYFVMELVRGIRITDYCDQNCLATKARLDLFIQVCQAIQHAHQKGIIHRDIKPSNILVTVNDGVPVPKVIDFGIAKATEGRLTDATVYTQLHQFMGTPSYMSPEQAETTSLDIDTRSDIYSLGVLLYELLTGRTPLDVRELMSQGIDAMRRTIREREPAKPSTRLATLNAEELTTTAKRRSVEAVKLARLVRGDLDWIVMKCLEKDRTRRYETANGLAADLKRHLHDEPVAARPPSRLYVLQRMVRRHKVGFAAAAAVILALTAGVVISAWQAVRATRAERKTAAERDAKDLARQDAEAISRFLSEVLQSPDPARGDGRTVTVAETLDKAVEKLETDPATQPDRRAKLQATLGETYFALGLHAQAILLDEKVRDYYLSTLGREHPDTLPAMGNVARDYGVAGRLDEAVKLGEEVLRLRHKVSGPGHLGTIKAMGNLALSYDQAGRHEEALKLHEDALAIFRKGASLEHPYTLTAMNNLANCYAQAGRWDAALRLREEALPLSRKTRGQKHPATLHLMNNLANSYFEAGRHDEALKLREEVLALRRKVNGPEHPDTLRATINLAISCGKAGRQDEALKLHEEGWALFRKVLGPENPETISAIAYLASACAAAGRREEALQRREEVVLLRRKVLGPEHPDTLNAMNNLAASYSAAGRRTEAIKLLEELLGHARKALRLDHADTLIAMNNLAKFYADAGRQDEALQLREEVLALSRKMLGPEHEDSLRAMFELANAYDQANRRESALKLREEALALARRVFGPDGSHTITVLGSLAISYADAGRLNEAVPLFEEVLAFHRKVDGPEHADTLGAMNNLARVYALSGRRDQALQLQQEALPLCRKLLGPEHSFTLAALGNLADSLLAAGRQQEAIQLMEEGLSLRLRVKGPEHRDTLQTLNTLAWVLATSHEAELRNGTKAVQLAEQAVRATARRKANYLSSLAAAYAETQQFDKAAATQREAIPLYKTDAEKKDAQSRLELYQAGKPFRQPSNR